MKFEIWEQKDHYLEPKFHYVSYSQPSLQIRYSIYNLVPYLQPGVLIYNQTSPIHNHDYDPIQSSNSPFTTKCPICNQVSRIYNQTSPIYNQVPYLQPGVPIYNQTSPIYNLGPYLQPGVPICKQFSIYIRVPYLQPGVPIYNQTSPIYSHDYEPIWGSNSPFTTKCPIYNQVSHIYNQASPIYNQTSPIYNQVPYLQPDIPHLLPSPLFTTRRAYLQPSPLFTTRHLPLATMILTLSVVVVPQLQPSPLFTTRHPPFKTKFAKIRCQKSF